MNTSLSWIKAYVPELEVTAGIHRCYDPVRLQGGRIYKNGCRSGENRDRTDQED